MSMESSPESPRRALIHDLTPVALLVSMVIPVVSIVGLGFVMHEQTSSLAAQIRGVEKRLFDGFAEMNAQFISVNARLDEVNARLGETNARIDGLATSRT